MSTLLTLSVEESLKLTCPTYQEGIVETMAPELKIVSTLPFAEIAGNTVNWVREGKLPDAQYREVGEDVTANSLEFIAESTNLCILSDEIIVDTFVAATEAGDPIAVQMQTQVALKSKSMLRAYEMAFLHGDSTANGKEFDGLDTLCDNSQIIHKTGSILNDVETLIDMIKGQPTVLIMTKSTRRILYSEARAYITMVANQFGAQLYKFGDDIFILDIEDHMAPLGTVYAVKYDAEDGVCGIHNSGLQIKTLGEATEAPHVKTRLEWFTGLAMKNPKALAIRV